MAKTTIGVGTVLILLGLIGYFGFGRVSVTALIPAFFGIAILMAGLLAQREGLRKHAMHAAAALGLLGFLGSAGRIVSVMVAHAGTGLELSTGLVFSILMALVCAVFVGLCVKSFIDARRNRAAA